MEARDVQPQQGGLATGQAYLPQDVCAMRCGVLCVVLIFWLSTTAIDGKKNTCASFTFMYERMQHSREKKRLERVVGAFAGGLGPWLPLPSHPLCSPKPAHCQSPFARLARSSCHNIITN